MVNTQNSYLYIKDVNSIIYAINFGGDSIIIAGIAPVGATTIIKLANSSSVIQNMIGHTYKDYASVVTTVALIKAGRGVLHSIDIDSVGVGGKGTCTIWDGATTGDTLSTNVPLFSGTITAVRDILKDVQYSKGLVIKQKTTTAGRVHVSYYLIAPPEREFFNTGYKYIAPTATYISSY
jgi:hypothetical protein